MTSNDDTSKPFVIEHRDPTPAEHETLYAAVGEAMANWAKIEHALAQWFPVATKMDMLVGQQIFLSSRSFDGKKRMLVKAIQFGKKVWQTDKVHVARLKLVSEALGRVAGWERTRNEIAHNTITVMTIKGVKVGGVVTPTNFDMTERYEQTLPLKAINETAKNFRSLASLLLSSLFIDSQEQLEARKQQFGEFPKVPYSTTIEALLTK